MQKAATSTPDKGLPAGGYLGDGADRHPEGDGEEHGEGDQGRSVRGGGLHQRDTDASTQERNEGSTVKRDGHRRQGDRGSVRIWTEPEKRLRTEHHGPRTGGRQLERHNPDHRQEHDEDQDQSDSRARQQGNPGLLQARIQGKNPGKLLNDDRGAVRRLKTQCERALRTFSSRPPAALEIDALMGSIEIYRQFECFPGSNRVPFGLSRKSLASAYKTAASTSEACATFIGGSRRHSSAQTVIQ